MKIYQVGVGKKCYLFGANSTEEAESEYRYLFRSKRKNLNVQELLEEEQNGILIPYGYESGKVENIRPREALIRYQGVFPDHKVLLLSGEFY